MNSRTGEIKDYSVQAMVCLHSAKSLPLLYSVFLKLVGYIFMSEIMRLLVEAVPC